MKAALFLIEVNIGFVLQACGLESLKFEHSVGLDSPCAASSVWAGKPQV